MNALHIAYHFALISRVHSKIPYVLQCVTVPKPLGLCHLCHITLKPSLIDFFNICIDIIIHREGIILSTLRTFLSSGAYLALTL